jgi:Holliday junction resolvase
MHRERHLQAGLEEHLRLTGWRYYHTHNSSRSVAGFPDIVALRGSRILVAEIKTERGRVSTAQRGWLAAFEAAGVSAYLWRLPGDWAQVGEVLR